MEFKNNTIHSEELPQVEEVSFEALEQDYLWMRLTGWGILFLIACGVLLIIGFTSHTSLWMLLLPWFILLCLVFFIEIKGFKIKGYALREKDVSYKGGLIFFSMTSIPFNRIQHCEISQGPLARLFELSSVKIYTAGGVSSDLSIGGISKEKAHRLREQITRMSAEYE